MNGVQASYGARATLLTGRRRVQKKDCKDKRTYSKPEGQNI